jgi:hypothetical protein
LLNGASLSNQPLPQIDTSGIAWTVDLLEHGYQGITSVSDTTHIWTAALKHLKAVSSVRLARSYKRRPDYRKSEWERVCVCVCVVCDMLGYVRLG